MEKSVVAPGDREDHDAAILSGERLDLEGSLHAVAEFTGPERFADIRRYIDPAWVDEALEATGTATVRRRRLPAEQVVWLVIGMAMFRKWPLHDLVGRLDLVMPGERRTVVPSSVVEARARVGAEPVRYLFERTATKWATASARAHAWRGLALYGVDGSTLRVADSEENATTFGRATTARGDGGYPLVRAVALMALRSHLVGAVRFGPYSDGEITLAADLWREVPDDSLVLVDRAYLAANVLVPLARDGRNRHWLTRAKTVTRWKVLESLGKNEDLVEFEICSKTMRADRSLPATYVARAIRYERKGYPPQTLLTSLLDPAQYPAKELIALYHERWEIELGYDEIKTEMLDRMETIRSRTVAGVNQEVWGIFLAYNLVRLEMERTARDFGVSPTEVSFATSLRIVCDTWAWCALASPGALPARLKTMREMFVRLVLPPRRQRHYPRAVKVKMTHYARKRSAQRP